MPLQMLFGSLVYTLQVLQSSVEMRVGEPSMHLASNAATS